MTREWLRYRPLYFYVACVLPAVMIYLQAATPYTPTFKGQNSSVWAGILGGAVVLVLWTFYRWPRKLDFLHASVFLLLIITWLYQVIRTQVDGSVFNMTAFLVPLILLCVLAKPPTPHQSSHGLLLLAYSLLLISLISLLFSFFPLVPNGFEVADSGASRIPLFSDVFGSSTRWGGPFGSVNLAAPAGGLIVIVGIGRKSWNRGVLTTGGLTVLALAQSRTALLAVLVSSIVFLLWSNPTSRSQFTRALRLMGVGTLAGLSTLYLAIFDPSLGGRTTVWSDYLGLLPGHWLFGSGESGINDFVNLNSGSQGFTPHVHAHSVVLDGLVRYGIVMLMLSLAIFTISLLLTHRAIPIVGAFPFALVIYVIMAGLTETIHSWNYWSVYMVAITSAVLMAASTQRKVEEVPCRI